jgi:elongation factor 2
MPKFRKTTEILKAMNKKGNIRNVGVIAHIDHGKTTLTDSLLAEAGLIPNQIAGTARVLDYLEEEQKRGITIKTANISLLHQANDDSYVINLVDTPGHVDFTDKVARALRATDGVIVVVDAVEEIMAQTQTVTRQALEERVKPILFINKVDRLIKEMKLPEKEIQTKLTRIINDFNNIIEIYGEEEFKDQWKVNPSEGSVIFGSALEKWGFILRTANERNVKFSEIIAKTKKHQSNELEKTLPLHEAILGAVVDRLPSPPTAQKYRIPKIWKGKATSEIGQAMSNCDNNAPTVICVTNVQIDPNAKPIATGRIFSGSATAGEPVYLVNAREEFNIKEVSLYMGAFRETVDCISAGNIAALAGLDKCRAGETVITPNYKSAVAAFEQSKSISEPVMTVAIEPKNPRDLQIMINAMKELALTDPSIIPTVNHETGEYLISGIGKLHLEIALKSLNQISGITHMTSSNPAVNHRESIEKRGKPTTAMSPHQELILTVEAQPADQSEITDKNKEIWFSDNQNNTLFSQLNMAKSESLENSIISSFQSVCRAGPLCAEPLRNVEITLLEATLHKKLENYEEAALTMKKVTFGAILVATPILLEPIYKIEITTPTELVGKCTRILALRRGKVFQTQRKSIFTIISGYVPVTETFDLSIELRSSTSGQVFYQCMFDSWQKTPENMAPKFIKQIREKKGLTPEIPKPQEFNLFTEGKSK